MDRSANQLVKITILATFCLGTSVGNTTLGDSVPFHSPVTRSFPITETPETPVRQLEPLRGEFHDDADMRPIVTMFLDELPARIKGLEQAIEASDLVLFKRLTHQLKGAAGGYGYPSITQAALTLERCLDVSGETWTIACRVHLDAFILLLRRARVGAPHLSQR